MLISVPLGNFIKWLIFFSFFKHVKVDLILQGYCLSIIFPWVLTLNRKTLTSFVMTKPRGSVVITKPLALWMSLCTRKASWLAFFSVRIFKWIHSNFRLEKEDRNKTIHSEQYPHSFNDIFLRVQYTGTKWNPLKKGIQWFLLNKADTTLASLKRLICCKTNTNVYKCGHFNP